MQQEWVQVLVLLQVLVLVGARGVAVWGSTEQGPGRGLRARSCCYCGSDGRGMSSRQPSHPPHSSHHPPHPHLIDCSGCGSGYSECAAVPLLLPLMLSLLPLPGWSMEVLRDG